MMELESIDSPLSFTVFSPIPKPETSHSTATIEIRHTMILERVLLHEEGLQKDEIPRTYSDTFSLTFDQFTDPDTFGGFTWEMVSNFQIHHQDVVSTFVASNLAKVAKLAEFCPFEIKIEVYVQTRQTQTFFGGEEEENIDSPMSFTVFSPVPKPETSPSTATIEIRHTMILERVLFHEEGLQRDEIPWTYSETFPLTFNQFTDPDTFGGFSREMVSHFRIHKQEVVATFIASNLAKVAKLAEFCPFEVKIEVYVQSRRTQTFFGGEEEELMPFSDGEEEEMMTFFDGEEEETMTFFDGEEEETMPFFDGEEEEIMPFFDGEEGEMMDALEEFLESAQQNHLSTASPASMYAILQLKRYIYQAGKVRELMCVICQEDFSAGETIMEMPCSHTFHCSCLFDWLKVQHFCPICRFELSQQRTADV